MNFNSLFGTGMTLRLVCLFICSFTVSHLHRFQLTLEIFETRLTCIWFTLWNLFHFGFLSLSFFKMVEFSEFNFSFRTELHLNFWEIFHRNRILLEVPKFHFRLPPDLGPVVNCDSDLIFLGQRLASKTDSCWNFPWALVLCWAILTPVIPWAYFSTSKSKTIGFRSNLYHLGRQLPHRVLTSNSPDPSFHRAAIDSKSNRVMLAVRAPYSSPKWAQSIYLKLDVPLSNQQLFAVAH